MKDFFKDLKVIELASVLAGPAVGLFFAELGAEVIKIENKKTRGDVTRRWKLPGEPKDSSVSAYYASVNGGKEALLLDLSDEEDQQRVHEMVREADIVISNFKEKSAVRMRMDYESLCALNPRLIYAQLYAFGQGIDRPAFDVVLQAEAGFLYMTGEPGRSPVKMPVALIDLLAAHQLKEGILIALLRREREGRGSLVSTSLLEAAIASLANQATNWLVAGHIPQPMGSAHPNIAPYGDVFSCRDEKLIVVAVGTEQQFLQLCRALEIETLLEDPRFQQNTARVAHREELWTALQAVFRNFSRDEAAQKLENYKVPYGCIRNMEEVFQIPEAQRLIQEELAEDGRLMRSVRTAVFNIQ
jgi:crotonobetainyl-CoA:carnitine CoA-transferase CaiB-like acyl-CoA transferase